MTSFHRWLGISIVAAFLLVAVYGFVARLVRRDGLGRSFWGLVYYTETLLVVQVVAGLVLLAIGRRVPTTDLRWLHYLYGSLFPLIAVVAGRLSSMRRERFDYVPVAAGAFVAFGLTARALMTADPTIFGA